MKKKSVNLKKLSVNKATIAALNSQEQNKVAGGAATGIKVCNTYVTHCCFSIGGCIPL
jgi:hypothetical protein